MNQIDVITRILEERQYQDQEAARGRWKRQSETPAEYLVDIRHYLRQAEERWVTTGSDHQVLDSIRKVAALAIAALEKNGCPCRMPKVSPPPGE